MQADLVNSPEQTNQKQTSAESLTERIRREIPISRALEVSVVSARETRVEVAAPLGPNINHEGTAFGGSVSSVALLAGWALVNINLDDLSNLKFDYVVVQDTELSYIKPIDTDFTAVAEVRSSADLELFVRALEKHGRGRISMQIAVSSLTGVCARMTARFVAQVKNPVYSPVGTNS